ncbi:isoprenylcysteine carboxyl methyltransferase family protein [Aureibacillus halotolerans]|uniref:15-methylpalmitoyl-4-hydroxy-2-pyrone 4-O-methyltransferase n=1 Tax=Aureibacillus halotolerans TaxID=1508390 RepID=A0A4R6U726_9BACI|nr:isoprenylcysteine carboxylmethyltransferase family protein [Aureibacillus halotolerans]TDQ41472.1 15-methylpalmitoyl-4-hydroxy-2-pyrone 4-O-methyltransferase [Aureibacillus halotolerans]
MKALFLFMYLWSVVQRVVELLIARSNEKKLLARGGRIVGQDHYKWLVGAQVTFMVIWLAEFLLHPRLSPYAGLYILAYSLILGLRIWTMRSLGEFWNTKIIVLPGATLQQRGPYKWMKHPNYVIVFMEMLLLPLMFQAYVTAFCGIFLQSVALRMRLPIEEQALQESTTEAAAMMYQEKHKFFPSWRTRKFQ